MVGRKIVILVMSVRFWLLHPNFNFKRFLLGIDELCVVGKKVAENAK